MATGRDGSFGVLTRFVAAQGRVAVDEGNVVGRDLGPTPGFAVLSLNLARELLTGVSIAAGVDNVFDRTYSEHLNLAGDSAFGYPADPVRIHEPGRTAWLKLIVKA
jgi:iron complex outermembrane receptor protein